MTQQKIYSLWPMVTGAVLAFIICTLLYYLPNNYLQDFLALLLASLSTIYLVGTIKEQKIEYVIIEIIIFIIIFAIALLGLYYFSFILAIGFMLHAIWSFVHIKRQLTTNIELEIPNFCLTFNLIIFLFMLIYSL